MRQWPTLISSQNGIEICLTQRTVNYKFRTQVYSQILQDHFGFTKEESHLVRRSDGGLFLEHSNSEIAISDKDNLVCCVIGERQRVKNLGCDLENLRIQNIDWKPFIGRFFTPADLLALQLYKNSQRLSLAECFLRFFSIKESYLKSRRLTLDPLDFSLGYEHSQNKFSILLGSQLQTLTHLKVEQWQLEDWLISVTYDFQPELF